MTMRWFAIAAIAGAATLGTSGLLHAQSQSVWNGIYTAAQADRGKTLFMANCAKCHGSNGEGSDEIPQLKGAHFMSDWDSQTVADLVQRVHGTMPLDNPGALNVTSATDVVAFLLQMNAVPAGTAELPPEPSMQSQFQIQAVNPKGT